MTRLPRKPRTVKGSRKVYFSLHPDDFDRLVCDHSNGAPTEHEPLVEVFRIVEVFRDALGVVERGTCLKVTESETDQEKSVAFEPIPLPSTGLLSPPAKAKGSLQPTNTVGTPESPIVDVALVARRGRGVGRKGTTGDKQEPRPLRAEKHGERK